MKSNIEIFKTEESALAFCIAQLSHHDSEFGDNITLKEVIKSGNWLINPRHMNNSCQCECGETSCVNVVVFDADDEQHYYSAGICNACGQE